MRTIEKLGMAFRKLLEISEKSPVTVTFRGVDDHNRKLYEVKNRRGESIPSNIARKLLETIGKSVRGKKE